MGGALANIYNNVGFALNLHAEAMARLQEQVSTGSRINRASDDPSAAYRLLGLNSEQRLLANYMDNISRAISTLGLSSNMVEEISSAISKKREELIQLGSDTYTQDQRNTLADGFNETLEFIVSLANKERVGQYLFGGNDTSSAPYVVQRSNGEITSVAYQGSDEELEIEVASGIESSGFYVGDDIFRSNDRTTPVFIGETGAAAGTGTSSIRGDVWLTVTGSTGNWTLSIDDGTSSVNVNDVADPSNVAVTNSDGDVLYVDATGITSTGSERVRVPGTYDIFNVLISIRDTLRDPKGISFGQLIDGSKEALGEVVDLLAGKQASIGNRIGFLGNLKISLERIEFDAEDEAAVLQQADITQVAIDISRREVLYQMSLAVAGRLLSMSLLDFII